MAWTRDVDFKSLLASAKTWLFDSNVGVRDTQSAPTFIEAFQDSIRANKAAHAFYRFWANTGFNPDPANHVDQLGDVGSTSGTLQFGAGATVAPDGNIWYSEASALVVSGDKTLVFRNVASPTADSYIYRVGMPFKLSEDRVYRCTVRWTSDTAARGIGVTVSKLDRTKTFDSATGMTPTIVTPNTFQYDSFVFQASGTANICHGLVYVFKDTSVSSDWNLYVDEILIEPIGEYFYGTNTAGTSIADASDTTVPFTEVTDYGSCFVTNTYTVKRPGAYEISAAITYASLPDNTPTYLYALVNSTVYMLGGCVQEGATTDQPILSGSVTLELSRGDTVVIRAYQDSVGVEPLSTNAGRNWLTIKRID